MLADALVQPHLDYCQTPFVDQSAAAEEMMERAYKRAARMVTRMKRSAPALEKLKKPTWGERRRAETEAFVAKIYYGEEPKVLRKRFPDRLQGGMETRAIARGEIQLRKCSCMGSSSWHDTRLYRWSLWRASAMTPRTLTSQRQ